MRNNLNKTLSELLNKKWEGTQPTSEDSYVVRHLYQLYGTRLNDFNVEDIRFVINQGLLPEAVVSEALDILANDILVAGDYYDGDLLNAVLQIEPSYWKHNPLALNRFNEILNLNKNIIESSDIPKKVKRNIDNFINAII